MKLLLIFIALNVTNVIIQTVKSICTIKCGKTVAALVNAVAYGLYTVVLVYTVCDLPLWEKVIIVGGANLIGVYVVKLIEEKTRKDKLWKIEANIREEYLEDVKKELDSNSISHNMILLQNKRVIVNCYSENQSESATVGKILAKYNAKYFVSENKTFLN